MARYIETSLMFSWLKPHIGKKRKKSQVSLIFLALIYFILFLALAYEQRCIYAQFKLTW